MARSTNGTGDVITVTSNAAFDLSSGTVGGWFKTTQDKTGQNQGFIHGRLSQNNAAGFAMLHTATNKIEIAAWDTAPSLKLDFTGTTTINDGTWRHICLVFDTANGATSTLYVAGASDGSSTNSAAWSFGANDIIWAKGLNAFWTLEAASYAEWFWSSAKLTAGDITALAKGYSPLLIQPTSLVSYWPFMGRSSPEPDSIGGFTGTLTGTLNAAHPRVIMPRSRRILYYTYPLRQVHYRFRTDAGAVDAIPTWGAAEDTNGFDPGTSNFRLRVSIANSGVGSVSAQPFELYLSKNSGAYAPITTSSTGGVKSADAGSDADNTVIKVPRLTPGA